jgi:hypothetical protein
MNYFEYNAARHPDVVPMWLFAERGLTAHWEAHARQHGPHFRVIHNWSPKSDAGKMSRDQLYHRRRQGFRIHLFATTHAARNPEAEADASPLSFTPPNGGCRPMFASWWEYRPAAGAPESPEEDDEDEDPFYTLHDMGGWSSNATAQPAQPYEVAVPDPNDENGSVHLKFRMDENGKVHFIQTPVDCAKKELP